MRLDETSEISLLNVAMQMSEVRAKIFVVTESKNNYNFLFRKKKGINDEMIYNIES